jgi:hypothetical protein
MSTPRARAARRGRRTEGLAALLALGLVALVAIAYSRAPENGFLLYDDDQYVRKNEAILGGLGWASLRWAFAATHASNWHPLTWLSHATDVQLFGLDPAAHHVVSVAWHALNAVLVLLVLRAATGCAWRSALVAALFAAHPLHVESVAWVAERKDLVSTFFWLAATLAWIGYVRTPTRGRYLAATALFVAGLLSKPMVVTWPATLLLLDAWPLARVPLGSSLRAWVPLVREKVPLFALSIASGVVTLVAQGAGGSVQTIDELPLPVRLGNAVVSAAVYLRKAIAPTDLAHPYVHPGLTARGLPAAAVVASALALGALTWLAVRDRRRRPWLLFGLAWYAITLLPVIGLVQVGLQGMADRYTYVPLLGPFVSLAWLAGAVARGMAARIAVGLGAVAALVACVLASRAQVAVWKDDLTLTRHAIEVTGEDNWLAWRHMGISLHTMQQPSLAWEPVYAWWRLRPQDPMAWLFLGVSHSYAGRADDSAAAIDRALSLMPEDPGYWYAAGMAAGRLGQVERVRMVEERLRALNPEMAQDLRRRRAMAEGRR